MTKIDVFSGFLGAGKTTLIKKLIGEAYAGEKLVLIENEFGEIGIDGGFMRDAGIEITEMNSGCICCSLVGDFGEALRKVLSEFSPDRILIEPSGVGKLSDVIRAVRDVCSDDVSLNAQTTVVDAGKCKMYMKNFGEFFGDQIKNASCIVLSHTDRVSDGRLADALAIIRESNPSASLVVTPWDQIGGDAILSAMEGAKTLGDELARLADEAEHHHHHHHEHGEECTCGHEHHHHHEHGEECTCGHEHHHHHEHGEECTCGHEHHHHHEHGEECTCGHEHHHHHEHGEECTCGHEHHHHHADEVFGSWGCETAKRFTAEELRQILETIDEDSASYGLVLRAKGIVSGTDGKWLHFDYVPDGIDVRVGAADVIGRLCVIGSSLNREAIASLFGVN